MAIDRKNLDENTRPGEDFYRFANGGWIKNHPLPEEFSRYGSFDILAEENNEKLRELVEEVAATPSEKGSIYQKVGDFYKSGMDIRKIEERGIEPLRIYLDQIDSLENKEQLGILLADFQSVNLHLLFSIYGMPDRKNSDRVIASISQGGLGLTDVDYYTANDARSGQIRSEYTSYIGKILRLSGENEDDTPNQASEIFEFEKKIAQSSMSRLDRRDPFKVYNMMTAGELERSCPRVNWSRLFQNLDLQDITEINVSQPLFFQDISDIIRDTSLETWKLWMKWSLVNRYCDLLSSPFVDARFEFYGAFLSGKKKIQPRWKRITGNSNQALGEAIGELFVKKYFPPESRDRMLKLVANLKIALAERINRLEWMSHSTKLSALEKLEAIKVKIGYPDKWMDYSPLDINDAGYFENARNASVFNYLFNIRKIGKAVDKAEWAMYPQTVNAYYNPSNNEIVFPAAILQPPFFFPDADDAVNYGAIGMVIGHELTHGFDDQGKNYDKNGNLNNWWSDEDSARFNAKTTVLADQYDQFTIMDGVKANGRLTLGENIADLGGLYVAYSALQKAWENNPPEKEKDGFTPSQRFFLSYAHVWANTISDEEMLRRTREDVHSLGHIRVNGPLRNMQQFADAFAIGTDEPMYLALENRAVIW